MKTLFLGLALIASGVQTGDPLAARSKGRPDAPVTVYEMADFQCPACRQFALNVFPTVEREFIETGKVRWVFINLPLTGIHPNAMAAAEVAMCAARQGRFWPMHDLLYQEQTSWARVAQPRAVLVSMAQRAGVNRSKLIACLDGGTARAEVERDAQRAARAGARATPSFYIEGGLLQGAPATPDPMRRLLDSIYAVRTRPPLPPPTPSPLSRPSLLYRLSVHMATRAARLGRPSRDLGGSTRKIRIVSCTTVNKAVPLAFVVTGGI